MTYTPYTFNDRFMGSIRNLLQLKKKIRSMFKDIL